LEGIVRRLAIVVAVMISFCSASPAQVSQPACVETPRPDPSLPQLVFQRQAFGFHDEELVICSEGYSRKAQLAARLWVPAGCEEVGSCPGLVIAHGFGFNKEVTFADMLNGVRRGLVVLSYDVRGHGGSGEQVGLMGREEIADEGRILQWFHEHVEPSKTGFYGISQGGSHAIMAAVFNCGSERARQFVEDHDDDPDASCDAGGRWIDAIAPVQGPTNLEGDGTCSLFWMQAIAMSRFNLELTRGVLECSVAGTPAEGPMAALLEPVPEFELAIRDTRGRVGAIDVPVYLATGFFDRLVLPQQVTELYEALRSRVVDGDDPYKKDVRLLVSNDGHGAIGGNFAALDDIFGWLANQLGAPGAPALRTAPVAIAEEWNENAFRLEKAWPIPDGAAAVSYYLGAGDSEANGRLDTAPPGDEPPDELRNVPFPATGPSLFFVDAAFAPLMAATAGEGLPGIRDLYASDPDETRTIEITGLPTLHVWVSSSDASGGGRGQLHVALSEITPDGQVTEFARNRKGLTGLGLDPVEIEMPLTISGHRIDPGNRLLLSITPSDAAQVIPEAQTDSLFLHHDTAHPSRLVVTTIDPDRTPPAGTPPGGASFTDDPLGAICAGLGLPCDG
jgi:predicted acyl esterase